MKLLMLGIVVLLAATVYADHPQHEHRPKTLKNSRPSLLASSTHQVKTPKSHSFVRHARKIPQLHHPRVKLAPQRPSPRQILQWKSKGSVHSKLRKLQRRPPQLKARQATGLPVPLPAFQNRPLQPIPSTIPFHPAQVNRNPRFRRLVTNLRQSASRVRQGIERGNSNLRQSFRSLQARNPLQFRRPIPGNRRRIVLPAIVFKRAEDMTGYEKFTLDEVVYPEKESEIGKRVDNVADVKLVDTPLDINPRTKTAHEDVTKEGTTGKDAETKKKSPEDFELRR